VEIARVAQPTLDQFQAAAEICEIRWPFLRPQHTRERFQALQKLGVELIAAREGDRLQGVCFALPCRYEFDGDLVEWVNLFQLATRPETKNIGALILMRIMSLYPTVVSLGVTEEATRMYVALRWKRYDEVWRGVHPIDMKRMADDYGERLQEPWKRGALRALAGVYNVCASPVEAALGAGVPCGRWDPASARSAQLREKGTVVGAYFPLLRCGGSTRFVDAGGTARVLNSYRDGWGGLREHARMWRELRRRGAKLCEVLATTAAAKDRLLRLGYAAVPMPMWYQDKNGMGAKLIAAMQRNEVSFFHTDKSI
jgi:hypothetical protein